jgi:hypothetical protein
MKRIIIAILLVSIPLLASAQKRSIKKAELSETSFTDTLTNEFLDSLNLRKKLELNDYILVGVQYGAGMSRMMWNPTQKQESVFMPYNFGITFTKYGKMFGYMPYFGFQAGIFLGQEGYKFKHNEELDYTYKIAGAESAVIDVVEVPISFQFHLDFWKMKVMAQVGCYGGYRLGIERFDGETGYVKDEDRHSFLETDRRVDYGIKGGAGLGFVFDPVEFHIMLNYKHALSSLYEPDHYSQYYYRFAYPMNFVLSAGIHVQLTKRTGKTNAQLKKMAKEMVYGN